jgi:hypothetical protein
VDAWIAISWIGAKGVIDAWQACCGQAMVVEVTTITKHHQTQGFFPTFSTMLLDYITPV